MSLSIEGKFLGASAVRKVGVNQTPARSFWLDITDNPEYPNTPEFQLWGDKVILVDNIEKGTRLSVSFNLKGNKYTKQDGTSAVATNLQAWKIEMIQKTSAALAGQSFETPPIAEGSSDDLPF